MPTGKHSVLTRCFLFVDSLTCYLCYSYSEAKLIYTVGLGAFFLLLLNSVSLDWHHCMRSATSHGDRYQRKPNRPRVSWHHPSTTVCISVKAVEDKARSCYISFCWRFRKNKGLFYAFKFIVLFSPQSRFVFLANFSCRFLLWLHVLSRGLYHKEWILRMLFSAGP